MNKSIKPTAPRQLTEEERKEQVTRAFLQKRASLAEGILFNLCQAGIISTGTDLVDRAIVMADYLMEKLYGAKPQEE